MNNFDFIVSEKSLHVYLLVLRLLIFRLSSICTIFSVRIEKFFFSRKTTKKVNNFFDYICFDKTHTQQYTIEMKCCASAILTSLVHSTSIEWSCVLFMFRVVRRAVIVFAWVTKTPNPWLSVAIRELYVHQRWECISNYRIFVRKSRNH